MNIHATMTQGELSGEKHVGHSIAPTLCDRMGRQRIGRFMHTAGGEKWFPFDVRVDEVTIETIAQQLATQARWQGATRHPHDPERIFYSVAEHSVYCSYFVPEAFALEALLHDASEAYIGDLIRPLKYDQSFHAPFKVVEEAHEHAIAQRFDLVYPFPADVKRADEAVCTAESRQIVVRSPEEEWSIGRLHDESVVANVEVAMLLPFDAKTLFLARFHELYDIEKGVRR